jgi:hypothetical protein
MRFYSLVAISFALLSLPDLVQAEGQVESLKMPPAYAATQHLRYTGCNGRSAFEPGERSDPVRSCVRTLASHTCDISAETCCFRQCIFSLTKKVTDLNVSAESPAMTGQITAMIQAQITKDQANEETSRSRVEPNLESYYHLCVDTCGPAVQKRLVQLAKRGKLRPLDGSQ